jgi:AcrR family transcriptional regulator
MRSLAVRAPQQPRAVATRGRIVAAAAQVLAARGYQGASTPVVAAAAAVSQGALFKHFPSKAALLAACVEVLLAGFFDRFRAEAAARLKGRRALAGRVRAAVEALWRIFRHPEMQAVFEVYVAARTDAALGAALAPILDRHRARVIGEAKGLFPEHAARPDFASVVDAVVYAMQGVVLGLFAPDHTAEADHLAFFERLALRELEAAR